MYRVVDELRDLRVVEVCGVAVVAPQRAVAQIGCRVGRTHEHHRIASQLERRVVRGRRRVELVFDYGGERFRREVHLDPDGRKLRLDYSGLFLVGRTPRREDEVEGREHLPAAVDYRAVA